MPEQHEPPRPHGDPLEDEVVNSADEPTRSNTSDANGTSAVDEDEGAARKKRYDEGAELVSKID